MKERVNELINLIDLTQNQLFDEQLHLFLANFINLPTLLERIFLELPSECRQQFNQILLALLQAHENKDYLLLIDLLEFELKPYLVMNLREEG